MKTEQRRAACQLTLSPTAAAKLERVEIHRNVPRGRLARFSGVSVPISDQLTPRRIKRWLRDLLWHIPNERGYRIHGFRIGVDSAAASNNVRLDEFNARGGGSRMHWQIAFDNPCQIRWST